MSLALGVLLITPIILASPGPLAAPGGPLAGQEEADYEAEQDEADDDARDEDGEQDGRSEAPDQAKGKPEPKPEEPPMQDEALLEKVHTAISGSGGSIDRCTGRYIQEFPKAKGKVTIEFGVAGGGRVSTSNVTSDLKPSNKITKCIQDVVRRWTFPPKVTFDLTFTVPVQKGAKFKLLKPGESPPPPPPNAEPGDDGHVTFLPVFLPSWEGQGKAE